MPYDEQQRIRDDIYTKLCKKHGLSRLGCAIHCTCGLRERAAEELPGHAKTCSLELPNFCHKVSGFEVRWYKYIGRGMETKGTADPMDIFNDCFASLVMTHDPQARKEG